MYVVLFNYIFKYLEVAVEEVAVVDSVAADSVAAPADSAVVAE